MIKDLEEVFCQADNGFPSSLYHAIDVTDGWKGIFILAIDDAPLEN